MTVRLALHLLGPPKLELDNALVAADRRKTLALLVYLALNRGPHTRDFLSALLWPDYDQAKAFTNLRHTLWETQQAIGDGWVQADRETIRLNTDAFSAGAIWLDVERFRSLVAESRALEDVSSRIALLSDAVQLYRNHFLTGFSLKDALDFNTWAFAESEELRHQLTGVLTLLADDMCALEQATTAIPYARRLITLDPLNEASHCQMMQVYIRAGEHNAALKQYQACEKILRKELGVDPQSETRALYKQIRKGKIQPVQPVAQKAPPAPQHNIPLQLSSFIGRAKELDEIEKLLADHRLVTLAGPGGIGKTRLSLKTGENIFRDYADGVWLVELASLSDPSRVAQTVAALFGLVEQADALVPEKLIHALRSKTTLLILDNCEHVLAACAQLADQLLKHCPNLKILATSREALAVTGELVYRVPSLSLPDVQRLLEQLLEYESVKLFEARARLTRVDFALTLENAAAVTRICRRLDGIPLAIELAAARVNMFSAEQIAARLDESFSLLASNNRTIMPRHKTLRASIAWSWDLLTQPESILLQRLSIFVGGWVLGAAETVCAGDGMEPRDIVDLMAQLVAKSLVVVKQEAEGEARYYLLEMIRQYAHEKRVAAGEDETIRSRHLGYYFSLSERIERELIGFHQMDWFARTGDERDNLRAALEYASQSNQVEAGLLISSRLRSYWEYFDNTEGARWLADFLQKPEAMDYPAARAKALYVQGWFLAMTNQFGAARTTAQECLVVSRACGDRHIEVDGLYLLGFVSEGDQKTDYCQQALALARVLGDPARQASALNFLGWDHSDLKRALGYWEEAIPLFRQIGNRRSLANCFSRLGYFHVLDGNIDVGEKYLHESERLFQELNMGSGDDYVNVTYGQIAQMRGEYEKARVYLQEDVIGAKEAGREYNYLWANFRLGVLSMHEGDLGAAREMLNETARAFHKDEVTIGVALALQYLGSLSVIVGKDHDAAVLIGWADATRAAIKNMRPSLEQAEVDHDIAALVARLGKPAFEEAYARGVGMSMDEVVAYALKGE